MGLAVQEFGRAVQLDFSNEDGLRGEADAFVKLGNPSAAEAAYKKAISLRPNYWGVYSWLVCSTTIKRATKKLSINSKR